MGRFALIILSTVVSSWASAAITYKCVPAQEKVTVTGSQHGINLLGEGILDDHGLSEIQGSIRGYVIPPRDHAFNDLGAYPVYASYPSFPTYPSMPRNVVRARPINFHVWLDTDGDIKRLEVEYSGQTYNEQQLVNSGANKWLYDAVTRNLGAFGFASNCCRDRATDPRACQRARSPSSAGRK